MNAVVKALRTTDRAYKPLEKRSKWSWARYWQHENHRRRGFLCTDHRSQEERDQDTLGKWYDYAVAAKREEANVARTRKAQAAMRHARELGRRGRGGAA